MSSLYCSSTKSIKFNNVMTTVISSINFIKARALNHRQFQEFLSDLEADHQDLTFLCGVRWLSRGKMLKRFYDLTDEVAIFMDMKGKSVPALKDKSWLCDLAFLVDVTTHLNEVNTNLQNRVSWFMSCMDTYSHLNSSFGFGKVN